MNNSQNKTQINQLDIKCNNKIGYYQNRMIVTHINKTKTNTGQDFIQQDPT